MMDSLQIIASCDLEFGFCSKLNDLGRVFTSKVYLPNICTPLYQIFKINAK